MKIYNDENLFQCAIYLYGTIIALNTHVYHTQKQMRNEFHQEVIQQCHSIQEPKEYLKMSPKLMKISKAKIEINIYSKTLIHLSPKIKLFEPSFLPLSSDFDTSTKLLA